MDYLRIFGVIPKNLSPVQDQCGWSGARAQKLEVDRGDRAGGGEI